MASAMGSARMMPPRASRLSRAIAERSRDERPASTARETAAAISAESVRRRAVASSSCSAPAIRSAATRAGSACDKGGYHRHEEGGGVDGACARDVEAGAVERAHDLADGTVLERLEGVRQLLFVEGADALSRYRKSFHERLVDLIPRLLDLVA